MAKKRDDAAYKETDEAAMVVEIAPHHPGPDLARVMRAQGITLKAAAETLAVNRSNLHSVLHGRTALTWEMAFRLADLIGVGTADSYMQAQAEWERAEAYRRTGRPYPSEARAA